MSMRRTIKQKSCCTTLEKILLLFHYYYYFMCFTTISRLGSWKKLFVVSSSVYVNKCQGKKRYEKIKRRGIVIKKK